MSSGGKVLVTGATGFVGAAVARALIARGEDVVLLARKNSPRGNVEGLDAQVVIGDLRDADSLAPAFEGVDRLYHVAADYRLWAPDPNEIVEANRIGVANIMGAALRAGVSRDRLHLLGGDAETQRRGPPGGRDLAGHAGAGHRRLQEEQDHRRAAGRDR